MSDYTQLTDFSAKDLLVTGTPEKKVRGSELDSEFSAISDAIATKYDSSNVSALFGSAAFSAAVIAALTPTAGTVNFLAANVDDNGGPNVYVGVNLIDQLLIPGPVTLDTGGSVTSGSLAGQSTGLAIMRDNGGANRLTVALRVLTTSLRASPQTAYFTSVTIAGVTATRTSASATYGSAVDGSYTNLYWVWEGSVSAITGGNSYTAVFA